MAALVALADQEPLTPVSLLIRTALRLPQHVITTVTANVPGPDQQLYIFGRPIREILPFVPIAERIRSGVAVTYGGQAAFGVTTDFASVPEVDGFAGYLTADVAALRDVCGLPSPRPVRRRRTTLLRYQNAAVVVIVS